MGKTPCEAQDTEIHSLVKSSMEIRNDYTPEYDELQDYKCKIFQGNCNKSGNSYVIGRTATCIFNLCYV